MRYAALLLCLFATALSAQTVITTTSEHVADGKVTITAPNGIEDWGKVYFSGDWVTLDGLVRQALTTSPFDPQTIPPDDAYSLATKTYSVIFTTTARKAEGEVLRVLLQPAPPGPYSTTLPGIHTHYELFVKPVAGATLQASYTATETDDPLLAALPGFFKQFDPKIIAPFFPTRDFAKAPQKTYDVELRRVNLPLVRAKIDVSDDLTIPQVPPTTPRQRIGLTAIAGVMLSVRQGSRVKVGNDGKLTQDPLSGGISVAAVNIHPVAYNPSTKGLTMPERFRLFIGPVLIPEFGVAAGGSIALIRGVTLNAGYSVLRINTLRPGDALDQKPTNTAHPFRNGYARVFFFGLGYNVK
jgi:hypothetical protein